MKGKTGAKTNSGKTRIKSPAKKDASAQSKTQSSQGATAAAAQDAVKLLKADHRKVEQLFSQFELLEDERQKEQIAKQICQELIVHTKLEEKIFYPACREQGVEDDLMDEAQVEHDGAKVMITELLLQQPDAEFYDAKVKVLSEYIKHHVREEEKSDGIFAKAKAAGMDMSALGQRLATRKQELMAEPEADNPEPPPFRSLQCVDNQQDYSKEEDKMNCGSNNRERDDQGRFTSDDDRGYSRGSSRSSSGRYDEDDRGSRSSRGGNGGGNGGNGGRGGWFGDSEGHSEASRRGWEEGHRGQSSRGRYDDDDNRGGRSSGRGGNGGNGGNGDNGGRGGWFGDSEGHSEASRRGWEEGHRGQSSRSRYDEDDRGSRSSGRGGNGGNGDNGGRGGWFGDSEGHSEASRRGWQRSDHGDSGWYGDSQGHSEASRRGWEDGHRGQGGGDGGGNGGRNQSSRGGYSSRGRDDDDDRGGRSGGRNQGGWFGDPEGHSEASRRGWRNRD